MKDVDRLHAPDEVLARGGRGGEEDGDEGEDLRGSWLASTEVEGGE